MKVIVHTVHWTGQTIAYGVGVDEAGETVKFAGDWRPMLDIAAAIERGEQPEAEVPEWAVLG